MSLIRRQDIRDNFDRNQAQFVEQVRSLLAGETYQFQVDFKLFHEHAEAAGDSYCKTSPGTACKGYVESFIEALTKWTNEGKFKPAVDNFNDLISTRIIRIAPDESISYSGCRVKDHAFEITYNPSSIGSNISYACTDFAKSFDAGLFAKNPKALPIIAQRSIIDDWESSTKANTTERASVHVPNSSLTLHADYQTIWSALVEAYTFDKDSVDLESGSRNMGSFVAAYFDGFVSQLESTFKRYDMARDEFPDICSSGEIWVEVAQKLKHEGSYYNECEFVEKKLIIRTIPKYWGTNTYDATQKMVELM